MSKLAHWAGIPAGYGGLKQHGLQADKGASRTADAVFRLCAPGVVNMSLSETPLFSYPRDPLTRFGFIVGDIIAWAVIVLIAYVSLRATIHF
jgi:hypothetical protein